MTRRESAVMLLPLTIGLESFRSRGCREMKRASCLIGRAGSRVILTIGVMVGDICSFRAGR
jgi:hypothetical protein